MASCFAQTRTVHVTQFLCLVWFIIQTSAYAQVCIPGKYVMHSFFNHPSVLTQDGVIHLAPAIWLFFFFFFLHFSHTRQAQPLIGARDDYGKTTPEQKMHHFIAGGWHSQSRQICFFTIGGQSGEALNRSNQTHPALKNSSGAPLRSSVPTEPFDKAI